MNTVSEVGKVIEVKGSSIFDIQIISSSKRTGKPSVKDQRKRQIKKETVKRQNRCSES